MKESEPAYFENENCAPVDCPPELYFKVRADTPPEKKTLAGASVSATAFSYVSDKLIEQKGEADL